MADKEKKSFLTLMSKFFAVNSQPTRETFPELPEIIVWVRFALAVVHGIWLGVTKNRIGGVNVLVGTNLVTFVPMLYCNLMLGVDHDKYDNKIFFAGVVNSLALLILIWTYLYTLEHESDEKILASALANLVGSAMGGEDVTFSDEAGLGASQQPVVEESEF